MARCILIVALAAISATVLPPVATAQVQVRTRAERTWHGHPVVAHELLVQFVPGTAPEQRRAQHSILSAAPISSVAPGLDRVALPVGADLDVALQAYARRPGVLWAQPNILHELCDRPDDPDFDLQWGLETVRADLAWRSAAVDSTALVAIIDTGVDTDHPDLADHYAGGYDFADNDADPEDIHGHGTHCAGIAAAITDNGVGMAGAGYGCSFLAYRCGGTTLPTSALVPAILDAVEKGALVLSMSWGSYYEDAALRSALTVAYDTGCVLVAAAGNDGTTDEYYPAAHAFVIGVGSSRQDDTRSAFSNQSPDWVDVAAPGQSIFSTWKNGVYTYSSGTSMATPMVAGLATLLYAGLPGGRTPANADLVRNAIEQGAVDIGSWVEHGRIDFRNSVDVLFGSTPAALTGVNPSTVEALAGDAFWLTGNNLAGASQVLIDGFPAEGFRMQSDDSLMVVTNDAMAMGLAPVVVMKPGGVSNSALITIGDTHPPRLNIDATVADGGLAAWSFGGQATHRYFLLVSIDDVTFDYHGWPILQNMLILSVGSLDAMGTGRIQGNLPSGLIGLTFYSQVVTVESINFVGASPVRATTITQ